MRDGYEFRFEVTQETSDDRGRVRRQPRFIGLGRTRAGTVRVDYLPGTEPPNRPGDWFVTRDGGRTLTMVDTTQRVHYLLSVAEVRDRVGASKGLDVTVEDLETSVQDRGDCGEQDGVRLRCLVVDRRYTVTTRYWVMRTPTRVVERLQYRIAPSLAGFTLPTAAFHTSRIDLLVRGDSAFAAGQRTIERAIGSAAVLRLDVAHTEYTDDGRATMRRTIEATRVRRVAVDAALFDPPAAFRAETR